MDIQLIVGFVAGLFSLLGAFLGAYLARRTQYEKWLIENRSEVFAKFLDLVHKAREKATTILFDSTSDALHNNTMVTQIYSSPINYSKIVSLYLPKNQREKFQNLTDEIWALHAIKDLSSARHQKMDEKLKEIQEIFESILKW